jgi:unsaturated rhamnogalacturonyl hydrolase
MKNSSHFIFACISSLSLAAISFAAPKPVVALDCFHNNEPSPHYTWQLTSVGGYSQLATVVLGLGYDTLSIKTAVDSAVLSNVTLFIIADPDDSSESPSPKLVSDAEADVLDKWVQRGGKLMLLGNNKGNCEFPHFNVLANKFGITFNEDTQAGTDFGPLPQTSPLFTGCDTLHIKDMCTLKLVAPAQAVFTFGAAVLIATSTKGTNGGTVFALGDPWVYNEYINSKDNKLCVTNVLKWLVGSSTAVSRDYRAISLPKRAYPSVAGSMLFLANGRACVPQAAVQSRANVYIAKTASGIVKKVSLR